MRLDISANSTFMQQISPETRAKLMDWVRSNDLDPDEVARMIVDTESDTAEVIMYDLDSDGQRFMKTKNTIAKHRETLKVKKTGQLISVLLSG